MIVAYSIDTLRNPDTRTQAFAAMVRDTTPKLYTQIRRIVQYHDDADDVLQNTYMKAWQALDSFRGDCQISTWLYRIAMNEALSLLQRQHAIATLPEKQRIVFNLKYFDEMKYKDMSTMLETSVGALKASYHLAVKKIEEYFNAHD